MSIENLVVLKGSVDGITVHLDQDAPFEEVLTNLEEKLRGSKKFFTGAKVSMRFKGRALSKLEQDQLLKVLAHQNILDISFVHQLEEGELAQKEDLLEWMLAQLKNQNTSLTYFHYGMLRSGQEIDYKGSVVVLGDVNPGAIIKADDNIIVLGNLKGKAHAGLSPTVKTPFILAFGMYPVQIGIRHMIAQSPDGDSVYGKKEYVPQIAYLNDDQIYVEEIDFKTFNHMVE